MTPAPKPHFRKRPAQRSVGNLDGPGERPVHVEHEIEGGRDEQRGDSERCRHDAVVGRAISETAEDQGQPGDQHGDDRFWNIPFRLLYDGPALLDETLILLAGVDKNRLVVAVRRLDRGKGVAERVQQVAGRIRLAGHAVVRPERTGDRFLDIGGQLSARIDPAEAVVAQGAVENDHVGGEGVDVAVDAGIGVLRRIDHQAEDQRRHHDEDVGDQAHDRVRIVVAMVCRQQRRNEHGGQGRAEQGRKDNRRRPNLDHEAPFPMVRTAGIEPARASPRDFKSLASTSSATSALRTFSAGQRIASSRKAVRSSFGTVRRFRARPVPGRGRETAGGSPL